jgi:hypothetical protein
LIGNDGIKMIFEIMKIKNCPLLLQAFFLSFQKVL